MLSWALFYYLLVVGRAGFEPAKALSQQIYSLPRLATSVPTHLLLTAFLNRSKRHYTHVAPLCQIGFQSIVGVAQMILGFLLGKTYILLANSVLLYSTKKHLAS